MPALHLVRHAEPAITGVLLGHTDPPLSEAGRQQCPLILLNADVLYTSPLLRTRETAELIAHGREIVILSDLAEMSL
ncbi:MAG: histidine phosphatase family protein, partial [Bryobacteraceae bacterium]|nr:histidine phosphatase family protein [Bryobacteraceae bacterium]